MIDGARAATAPQPPPPSPPPLQPPAGCATAAAVAAAAQPWPWTCSGTCRSPSARRARLSVSGWPPGRGGKDRRLRPGGPRRLRQAAGRSGGERGLPGARPAGLRHVRRARRRPGLGAGRGPQAAASFCVRPARAAAEGGRRGPVPLPSTGALARGPAPRPAAFRSPPAAVPAGGMAAVLQVRGCKWLCAYSGAAAPAGVILRV